MKNKPIFYLIVAVVIILFDVVGSFASKSFGFDYTILGWISACLYLISGYFGCQLYGLKSGIFAGLVAGMADSTIGWWLSSLIRAYIPFEQPEYTFLLIIEVIAIVSIEATLFGLIGAFLGFIINRRSRITDA